MQGTPMLTDSGKNILSKSIANKVPIILSSMALGDGISSNIPITEMINSVLKEEIENYSYNNGQAYVRSTFTNANLAEGFYIREIGIYALDPDNESELLFAYINTQDDDADYFSPGTGKVILKEIIEVATGFSGSQDIHLTIDTSTAMVTVDEFNSKMNEMDQKTNFLNQDIKNLYTSLANQIGTTNGASINLPKSSNGGLLLKELQGKSVQNGIPTPESKVDIVSVGDNGSIVVRVTGKNLLDFKITESKGTGLTYVRNSDGTITVNGTVTGDVTFELNCITPYYIRKNVSFYLNVLKISGSYTGDIRYVSYNDTWGGGKSSEIGVEIPRNQTEADGNDYRYFRINFPVGTVCNNLVLGYVAQKDNITTYEQYKEQLVTIPLIQPLRSIGSVYDRIIKKDGIWGVERKFGVEIFDGSSDELWSVETTNTNGIYRIKADKLMNVIKKVEYELVSNLMSNRYKTVSGGDTYSKTQGISSVNTGRIVVYDSNFITSDASLYKTWLSTNPLTVIYELATPTFEPFSQSIQDQLNKLQSYQGVTNVFTTDALQPNLIVQYGKTDASALSIYANNVSDNKLDKSKSVNNLITTAEGTVLDGRQGKALNEKIGNLSDLKTASKTDLVGAVNEVNNKFGNLIKRGFIKTVNIPQISLSQYTCYPFRISDQTENWTLTNGAFRPNLISGQIGTGIIYNDYLLADGELGVTIENYNMTVQTMYGFVFRYKDNQNYLLATINPLVQWCQVYKVVDGVITNVYTKVLENNPQVSLVGEIINLKLRFFGSTIEMYYNGTKYFSYSAQQDIMELESNGHFGLFSYCESSISAINQVGFSNLYAKEYRFDVLPSKVNKMLNVGDSITQATGATNSSYGWVSLLGDKLKKTNKDFTYLNVGLGGATTDYMYKNMLVPNCNSTYDFCTIIGGSNDAIVGTVLTPRDALKNIRKMIRFAKSWGVIPIVGITTNMDKSITTSHVDITTWRFCHRLENMIKKLCAQEKVICINLNDALNNDYASYYVSDKIHPNDAGNVKLYEEVYNTLIDNITAVN